MSGSFKARLHGKMRRAGMTGALVSSSPAHFTNRLNVIASSSELGKRIRDVIVASFKMQEYLDNARQNGRRVDVQTIKVIECPQFSALQLAMRNLTTLKDVSPAVRSKIRLASKEFYEKGTYDSLDDYLADIQETAGPPTIAGESPMNFAERVKAHMTKVTAAPTAGSNHNKVLANYCTVLIEYGYRWQNDPSMDNMGSLGSVGHIANNFYSAGVGVVVRGLSGVNKGLPSDQETLITKIVSGYRSGSFNWINDAKALLAKVKAADGAQPSKIVTQSNVETTAAPLGKSTYDWYQYNSDKPTTITTVSGKQKVRLTKGSRFGIRMSTTKDITRIITDELGPTIVFSYAQPSVPNALKKNSLRLLGGKTPKAAPKADPNRAFYDKTKAAITKNAAKSGDAKIESVQGKVGKVLNKVNDKFVALSNNARDLRKRSTYMKARKGIADIKTLLDAADTHLLTIRALHAD